MRPPASPVSMSRRWCSFLIPLTAASATAAPAASTAAPIRISPPMMCPNSIMNSATMNAMGSVMMRATASSAAAITTLVDLSSIRVVDHRVVDHPAIVNLFLAARPFPSRYIALVLQANPGGLYARWAANTRKTPAIGNAYPALRERADRVSLDGCGDGQTIGNLGGGCPRPSAYVGPRKQGQRGR